MKKVFILGSTGSIGINCLNVISNLKDEFKVTGLTVNSNTDLLLEQIKLFKPEVVAVKDEQCAKNISGKIPKNCNLLVGEDGLVKAAVEAEYDIFMGAMVGFAGLAPTIEAVKRGKRIALANKETLVVAGEIVTDLCRANGSEIIPVDSEHSAIYQCLVGENLNKVEKLILTASGGPFREKDKSFFESATVDEALNHPNWKMGNKITIDSATMMNKGLEVIEAHWLFGLPADKIEIVIHPQSIIHSMVQFVDGSMKAQMGLPDMKLPIQYALTFPERMKNQFERTNLSSISSLTFYEPDFCKFECLKLAFDALKSGGTAACILNAANEVAVGKFLHKEIKFSHISLLIKKALDKIENKLSPDLKTIFECDRVTREFVMKLT
ncbi:MAG: 1-deoxy-D-xylulose-5-phosphate reductoisomerase [Ignavibacteriota bacterium]|nr:MAG: 1-deoxy-D-xylulose-5-phosphate reductoisomerase [Chlorobiota bacterium]MBE7475576.1 1-deoxy-D-xylulose-5-phosphate reductoisomerase [Ignavibacteriales bacterium]MBL1123113.1 1-deoxy-D-xylulose-5-phosphate reductoisomerase [Ignavibacteriota bacterium]MCE7855674.1 1-deoxy-D-xylulose-5-phosphate reductoisomerase [Ignavibacteria bacterium CHB3]GJQ41726.1 MAG: 1-deoxy-D-xylulose 5-phosphate reductoisomerase [Ignavibacteriaceae bacterium]